jgi:glyoxylase-like metal-dependent hydrolase (beta-lactamase superfamily II)
MLEQLWLFHCGWIRVPKPAFVAGAPMSFPRLPMLAAVAYHTEHGPILIDAPFGHEGPSNVGALLGLFVRTAGFKFEDEWSIVPRLEQLGFRTSEVHHILMTHLHADHTGGMKELGHARFHIARSEWEFPLSLTPFTALREGYQPDDFRAMRNRIELFDDPAPLADDPTGLDIFGDGSIHAVGLPGHSVGHVGYRLTFDDGRKVFLVGDAAFSIEHVIERRGLGPMARSFGYDVAQAADTLRSLRLYNDEHPDEVIVPSHDFAWGERCLDGPTPLHQVEA